MKAPHSNHVPAFAILFAILVGCSDGGPTGPGDDGGGSVSGKTATFEGLSVTLLQTGDNWESDNQFATPDPGSRFYTVEVRYQNASGSQRTFNPFDFQIETSASTRIGPTVGWREPAIHSGNLATGDQVVGWVTFELPIGQTAVRLLYSPRFDVTLAIPI
jgi:hypothetical protein